ncbi:flagellar protein FlaG [Aestuariibacter salexigens]|uniref:flagellar protein FlaG n=1 Tax=Aestuariibacter salexigens TaxID=226010 RepID=UPI00041DE2FF|nr:flagellar protein FlaG [Aestuariibacter salexigens]
MDIDFSQIGQNVAAQVAAQNASQNTSRSEQPEKMTAQTGDNNEQKSSQGPQNVADIVTERNVSDGEIETAVADISDFVQAQNRQLSFSIDEDSRRSVVKVTDSESGEVIRQIPSEEVLALSERIKELQSDVGAAVGVLFNRQA